MSTKIYMLENLGCAHCAAKMEEKIGEISGVLEATITFATKQLRVTAEDPDVYLDEIRKICSSIESQVKVVPRELKLKAATEGAQMEKKKFFGDLSVILAGAVMFAVGNVLHHLSMDMWALVVFGVAYFILGGKILLEAAKNISHGQIFDENFLRCIATIGAFLIKEYQ